MSKYNFHKDLRLGAHAEELLCTRFSNLERIGGRGADLVAKNGCKIEVKCDTYDMAKTPNFFIEHFGDVARGRLGGPWKAAQDGCEYFIYYFISNDIGYIFHTATLLAELERMALKPIELRNARWTTVGYRVPRDAVSHIGTFGAAGLKLIDNAHSQIVDWGYTL